MKPLFVTWTPMKFRHLSFALFACMLLATVGFVGRAHALAIGLPGLPGIPGVNPQKIAIDAAARQLAPWVNANQPIIRDWSAVFPTQPTLSAATFNPVSDPQKLSKLRASIASQLARSTTGIISLAPGDYALETRVYCTDIHRHAGHRALWLLGPLRGSRAGVLTELYAHASGKNVSFGGLQSLSWAMQAGMRYDELPPNEKHLFDQLIPDLRSVIAGSFMDQVQGRWNNIARTVPNVPSFDEAIARMGETGQTILTIKDARDQILSNASDFSALSRSLAPPGGADDESAAEPPWSAVSNNVFERLVTHGNVGSDATLEIRVVGPGRKVSVPLTNIISYPPNHQDWQPLTQESPTLGFGVVQL